MFGAIVGDVVGSTREGRAVRQKDFELLPDGSQLTDDTVLTVAQADQLLRGADWVDCLKQWARRYPNAGYGGTFIHWMLSESREAYDSWGNGSAMRVGPVAWAHDDEAALLAAAEASAAVTHSHPEGIRGAQATALAIWLARRGAAADEIRARVAAHSGYDLDRSVDEVRPGYGFDVSCQGSVPESLICALEAADFEDAIRNAVSLGGDADTMACIAGAVAEPLFGGVPQPLRSKVWERLTPAIQDVVRAFYARFVTGVPGPEDP